MADHESGASQRSQSVLLGSGTAFAVTALVGAALYAAVPAARVFSRAPAPSPDISRYLLDASYGTLVMFSALAAALFTATACLAALQAGAMPRWLAVAGLPPAVLMPANAVMPMGAITLWFAVAGITLAARPVVRSAAVPTPPASLPLGVPTM